MPEWGKWIEIHRRRAARSSSEQSQSKYVEARLDVEAVDLNSGERRLFDATLRTPTAPTYLKHAQNSATEDGFACKAATRDKQRRYPAQAGLLVETCAAEAYGRLGDEFLEVLAHLHLRASQESSARNLPQVQWYSRWLDRLSAGIARGVSRAISDSLEIGIHERA